MPQATSPTASEDPSAASRFQFGENWAAFLSVLDDERIAEAERSLRSMLELERLDGMTFLDVGSGSGLFSLAALRLGAARVHSLDVDPQSVACALELRSRSGSEVAERWTVERASALDAEHLRSLGTWDVVYSWGVLHHTGDMWQALENITDSVVPGGRLFISIYNDQGLKSRIWRWIKHTYNRLPERGRIPYAVLVMLPLESLRLGLSVLTLRPGEYVRSWTRYKRSRGMSRWHDLIDWVGGYPFEVATPDRIFTFYRRRGFSLLQLVTRQGTGCNEFVFVRQP